MSHASSGAHARARNLVLAMAIAAALSGAAATTTVATPAADASSRVSCELAASSLADCRERDWARWQPEEIDSVTTADALGGFLDDLLQGRAETEAWARAMAAEDEDERRRLLDAPVPEDDCLLRSPLGRALGCDDLACVQSHFEAADCTAEAVVALANLAATTDSRPVRMGAATMAFTAYVAVDPNPADEALVREALTELARSLLAPHRDAMTQATALMVMEFSPVEEVDLTSRVARLMSAPRPLVRVLAINELHRLTACPLMDDWPRDAMPSDEQVAAAQEWWVTEGIAAAPR